jgi:HNH endonuclease
MKKGQRTYKPCVFPNCSLPRKVYFDKDGQMKGYLKCCENHFGWNRIPGPTHPNATKHGRRMNDDGYIEILNPRKAGCKSGSRYILEHRWVIEQAIGRQLEVDEKVHHMNGVRDDNRLEIYVY